MKKMDKEEYLKRADEINEAIDKVEKRTGKEKKKVKK